MLLEARDVTKAFGSFKAVDVASVTLEQGDILGLIEPNGLLLDEAMAGLTQREVQLAIDLVRDIHRSGITLVIVEHIMEVIMSLATRVVVFHQGREIARGSPREVTGNPAVIAAYLGTRAAKAAAGHTPIELMGGPIA